MFEQRLDKPAASMHLYFRAFLLFEFSNLTRNIALKKYGVIPLAGGKRVSDYRLRCRPGARFNAVCEQGDGRHSFASCQGW